MVSGPSAGSRSRLSFFWLCCRVGSHLEDPTSQAQPYAVSCADRPSFGLSARSGHWPNFEPQRCHRGIVIQEYMKRAATTRATNVKSKFTSAFSSSQYSVWPPRSWTVANGNAITGNTIIARYDRTNKSQALFDLKVAAIKVDDAIQKTRALCVLRGISKWNIIAPAPVLRQSCRVKIFDRPYPGRANRSDFTGKTRPRLRVQGGMFFKPLYALGRSKGPSGACRET